MKRFLILFVCFGIVSGLFFACDDSSDSSDSSSNPVNVGSDGSYAIVDTNQNRCFDSNSGFETDCSGSGYDADYAGNQPDYSDNGDDTISDNVTGLMWTKSPDLNGDGSVNSSDKKSQSNAVTYCEELTLSGYSDWRLPDIKTLYSLMDFTGNDPSGYTGTASSDLSIFIPEAFVKAFGDTDAGERLIDGQYATTTIYVYYTNLGNGMSETMFGVNFVDGRIKGYPTSNNKKYFIHCVRGNEDYGKNLYTANSDETVSDLATGLMWQQNDSQSVDFDDAVSICEKAETGGFTDWRLPNIKELHSIVDYSRSPDTTNSAAIDSVFNSTSISNEGGSSDWGYYWSSTTHTAINSDASLVIGKSASYVSFGRALGYIDGSVYDVHGAGAQRSNSKLDVSKTAGAESSGSFYYHGPQGDILRNNNMVRCVRTI
jgi:hypothetical protein